ncbi:MAG: master DNA invertase Mpi family serine-type recombinase [Alphaproteobacteria bacterium]|nr:master DNA invertase Mpi family serine-type recombinase [Alphaproteobacteria bacterium]
MIYGYIRVSTDHQTTENQRFEIKKFCEKQDMAIDCWIEETISSTKDLNKRKLGRLLRRIQKDDLIIASELSRLGRNLLQVMSILHHCMDVGAKIWTIKDNYRLGADITSKVLAFAFGLSAEIERNLISQRTKEALARVKSEGKRVGRPLGSRNVCKLEGREKYISQKLGDGRSKYEIARRLRVHRDTLAKFIEKREIRPDYTNAPLAAPPPEPRTLKI